MESFLCISKLCSYAACLLLFISLSFAHSSEALNPTGNITIKWDVVSWTPDGYVAVVSIYNYQKRHEIKSPGWKLSWNWAKKEVIWSIVGSRVLNQGNCSMFRGNIPQSCKKNPTVVDLPPSAPYTQQIANCCKSGVLVSNAESAFQISVGRAGNSVRTVKMPRDFTFVAPKQVYVCGPARIVKPTIFISADKRRFTRALMTWNGTCIAKQQSHTYDAANALNPKP